MLRGNGILKTTTKNNVINLLQLSLVQSFPEPKNKERRSKTCKANQRRIKYYDTR